MRYCDNKRPLFALLRDLFSIVELIQSKGADIKSLKETWLDTTTPHGKLMFTIFAGLSQFEADLTAQRTREGLAAADSLILIQEPLHFRVLRCLFSVLHLRIETFRLLQLLQTPFSRGHRTHNVPYTRPAQRYSRYSQV